MLKRVLLGVGVLAMVAFASGDAAARRNKSKDGEPKPVFVEKVYDFGSIEEKKGAVSHDFVFTNEGDGNLVILNATAECGCTRPDYPKEPIAPGRKKSVKVTYNPAGRPGPFDKTVTLTTNASPRKIRLKIRGTVR